VAAELGPLVRPGNGFARFAIGSAAALGLALVPLLLAASQGEFDFDSAVLEVHARGDEGEPSLLRLAEKFANFLAVNEQLARAKGCVVRITTVLVWTDVAVKKPEFAVLDQAVGVFETDLAGTDRFDLGAGQRDSGFIFFEQEIVVAGVPIGGGIPLAAGGGLAARLFLSIRLGLVGSLPRHV